MQVDESNEDRSKRQKVTHGADMELEGLVVESERDRLQRYSDCDFLMQAKQNADIYLDRIFSNDHRKREIVKKEWMQLGVHPSVHVAEVFPSPRNARLVQRFGLTPGLAFDLTFATRKAKFDCWELEWTQCRNVTHEVDDGHIPLASCSRTFLCTSIFWKVVSECRK